MNTKLSENLWGGVSGNLGYFKIASLILREGGAEV